MKGNNKRAIKVCDTEEEAEEYLKLDSSYRIEYRKGINKKCEDYCNACEFCNYYKEYVKEKENGN